jgi:hypothetical protein
MYFLLKSFLKLNKLLQRVYIQSGLYLKARSVGIFVFYIENKLPDIVRAG